MKRLKSGAPDFPSTGSPESAVRAHSQRFTEITQMSKSSDGFTFIIKQLCDSASSDVAAIKNVVATLPSVRLPVQLNTWTTERVVSMTTEISGQMADDAADIVDPEKCSRCWRRLGLPDSCQHLWPGVISTK